MTASATSALSANPVLASLLGRVKPLDPNELLEVAQQVANEKASLGQGTDSAAASTSQASAGATALTDQRSALEQQLTQSQQQLAVLMDQYKQVQAQAAAAATAIPTTQSSVPATAPMPTSTATTPSTSSVVPTAATSTSSATRSTAVSIPSSSVAPRTQFDYWTKHIAQFGGKYLPDGPSMRPNCGPASATMALRMIGLDIPGFSGQNSESVLDQARILATGKNDTSVGTTDDELERLINKSGGQWSETTNFEQVKSWAKQGIPVILSGNPSKGWNSRYSSDQVYPFDGAHWVTVSGYDQASGFYIVNDPLSQIGPIYVSEAELQNYNRSHGNLGIAVYR